MDSEARSEDRARGRPREGPRHEEPAGRAPGGPGQNSRPGWKRPSPAALGGALGVLLALPCALWLWGFTVDDALIPARVAAHLRQGLGPRFNPGGALTDAVTPLGFAHWIAAWASLVRAEPSLFGSLAVARGTGLLAWLGAAGLLGADLVQVARGRRGTLALGALAVGAFGLLGCVPLGAWAGSGLETPWVALCCTWAARPRRGASLAAGLAAAWRPELLPWALVLIVARTFFEVREGNAVAESGRSGYAVGGARGALGRLLPALAACIGPALVVASVRQLWFGRPTPLSAVAKAPDLDHGLIYCLGVLVFSGPWWLLVSRWTWRVARDEPGTWGALAAALGVHLAALIVAGGDWMPFYRLAVPVLPSVLLLGVAVAGAALGEGGTRRGSRWGPWAAGLRGALALSAGLLLLVGRGEDARRVLERRLEVVAAARPLLAGRTVAAVDVGWVAGASGGDVLDLAGVTEPRVAALPGGHTTKRVSGALLVERGVDALVLLAQQGWPAEEWPRARFRYGVDARLAPAAFDLGFRLEGRVPLPGTSWEYLVCTLPERPTAQAVSR